MSYHNLDLRHRQGTTTPAPRWLAKVVRQISGFAPPDGLTLNAMGSTRWYIRVTRPGKLPHDL